MVAAGHIDEWIVVLEFATDGVGPFPVADIDTLLEHLCDWDPSALWSPDRYAIQIQIPGPDPAQALRWAVACHRYAIEAAGLPAARFVRAEIMGGEEYEHSLRDSEATGAPVAAATPEILYCQELYTATRGLLAATTTTEISDTVAAFVTAIGGQITPGGPLNLPGRIELDVTIDGTGTCYASAEALSVAGLIIERSLSTLLSDAHQALARLRERHLRVPSRIVPLTEK